MVSFMYYTAYTCIIQCYTYDTKMLMLMLMMMMMMMITFMRQGATSRISDGTLYIICRVMGP